jgi:hypothetical protein
MELAFALSLLAKATAVTLPFVSPFLGPCVGSRNGHFYDKPAIRPMVPLGAAYGAEQ